jgi:hypothetical protein
MVLTACAMLAGGVEWSRRKRQEESGAAAKPVSSTLNCGIRCLFLVAIFATFVSSRRSLSHLRICDDTGEHCLQFQGAVQFSTFTRWSYMLEGAYFLAANLRHVGLMPARGVEVLFGTAMASAILVTTVTYGVLVPGAMLLPQPPHREGAITVLLSKEGHFMHSMNLVFMAVDAWLSKQTMRSSDMQFGVFWAVAYVLFEWVFFRATGLWHYPFMDYTKPFAPVIYAVLGGVFAWYWQLGCKFTSRLHAAHTAAVASRRVSSE